LKVPTNQGAKIMADSRADEFNRKRPQVTETDIIKAAAAKRVVVSFNAFPVAPKPPNVEAMAVKFLLGDGKTVTLLVDPFACDVLRQMGETMNKATWKVTVASQPPQKLH
jgi:hypothetical protein